METNEIIRDFTDDEFTQVARLHHRNIESGFLSSLGVPFLKLIYFSIQQKGILIGVRKDKKIIGFISGVENIHSVYAEFMKKNFLKAFFLILPKAVSFRVIKKLLDLVLYPFKKKANTVQLPHAELLSMALDNGHRGIGIADILYKELVKEFESKKVSEFKIIVGANLSGAQKFYEKMGASKLQNIHLHKGENSWVYLYQIKKL